MKIEISKMIEMITDYCNYDSTEIVSSWSEENIVNAYHNILKEMDEILKEYDDY